ncbi:uncharacterized protein B0I36DRAFT_318661 [Microdochium trichocladiopsis]|uniref:Secreted protein n=1 Tax=Microdochium trichocladiopsis TaxID=1682393 RepID=A0A9P8YEQ9_9PEZI|nr:uncharacterized protein B0I36DRAFT_318661 [Microdochium trichocladiopsis]KAH7035591.1 hypothetical protein B0I36DRAFT_318661 [Microdochium trichocladiopsis]
MLLMFCRLRLFLLLLLLRVLLRLLLQFDCRLQLRDGFRLWLNLVIHRRLGCLFNGRSRDSLEGCQRLVFGHGGAVCKFSPTVRLTASKGSRLVASGPVRLEMRDSTQVAFAMVSMRGMWLGRGMRKVLRLYARLLRTD